MPNFDSAFTRTMVIEGWGETTNHPNDAGKLTKFGLSKTANPDLDIANLRLEQAKEIYRERYWKYTGARLTNQQCAEVVFDMGVNAGPRFSVKLAQRAAGVSPDDGLLGSQTRAAIERDPMRFIRDFTLLRISYYAALTSRPTQRVFLRGWVMRSLSFL